ncbi:MAG: NUDIX hydrolase [Alphaproteobacteria bacterium]|nr:MAG: NUDIX hydrolase [Alphaproteobacteria bacterium]
MTDIPIIPVARLDLRFEPAHWAFASERRAEIDAHFARLRVEKPEMFNGRVLLLRRGEIADGVLSGAYLETDFASFISWRDWDFPDKTIRNCFPMAALRSSDGAFLLGVMGAHTATAGQIYFAAGTPDPNDIVGETVDLEGGVMRELTEETGLGLADAMPETGWTATPLGQRIALMKIVQARETAVALHERIRAFLAGQRRPELSGIHIVRGLADLRPAMPPYVTRFLRSRLR